MGLLLRLYDVCVPPTASYGCEVWGLRPMPGGAMQRAKGKLEQAHIKILRQIAGARTTVATAILFRELDARPLSYAWWRRLVRFWNSLAASPPESLHYQIALDDYWDAVVGGASNWASAFMKGLRRLAYDFIVRVDRLDAIHMRRVLQLLDADRDKVWQHLDICPLTCPQPRSQLCTYLRWFARPDGLKRPGPVLRQRLSAKMMGVLLRFRMGCHGLPKDVGRASVPRMQRVCPRCDLHEIGDEKHMVFTCTALQHIRERHAGLFSASIVTMLDFMWQADLVGVAKFVMDCLDFFPADVGNNVASDQP